MPAALAPNAPASKHASRVDEQVAQATSRIRGHDLAFGGLLLAAMLLVYATAMILLDKYAVLPDWVRQFALVAFAAGVGAAAYLTIVRPLRRRINPLYAAAQVEKTIEDAKNSVVGYVEAQGKADVHPTVKAAMAGRAAQAAVHADVNRAVDHRSLVYTGGVAVAFLLTLIALFFAFRPAQFASLVGRTFAPFTAGEIKSRTQLTLVEPEAGDVTITAGQSFVVRVQVGGKVPDPDKPDRLRVLLRHNPAAPEYEELPLEKGDADRDWSVKVPDYLVRNGVWYAVAGGDAQTPEYRVAVRSLPVFTEFEVRYEYPAYTRIKPEVVKDAHVRALRNTKVTITGKANRPVKDGRLVFDPATREPLAGTVPADQPDSIRFTFLLTAGSGYRAQFTAADGERGSEPPLFPISVEEDAAPTVEIARPEADVIDVPANGHLAVDGSVGDDIGIDTVALRLKLVGPPDRPLAGKPYRDGKSFRRAEKDGTFSWPTSLDYKDSVDLGTLTDPGGQKVELKEGMVLEYWLEAADNRTKPGAAGPEPDPNVGRSKPKQVRVTAPVVAEADKANQDQRKAERKQQEQKHRADQQQKLANEKRDPNAKHAPPPEAKDPEGKKPDENMGQPMPPPMAKDNPEPKKTDPPEPKMPPQGKNPPEGNPMDGKTDAPPMPMPGGMPPPMGGMPEQAPMPRDQNDAAAEKRAEEIQKELDRQKQDGGRGKPGPAGADERTQPADAKPPEPMAGGMPPPEGEPKTDAPKPNDPGTPMGGGNAPESKPAGNPDKGAQPSEPKPDPTAAPNPMTPNGGNPPPTADNKAGPKEQQPGGAGGAGDDKKPTKPQPGTNPPMPMGDPGQPQPMKDPSGGGDGKPGTQGKQPEPMPGGAGATQPDAGKPKPKPMPGGDPGADRPPAGDPMGGAQHDPADPKQKPDAGAAKPQTGPPPAGTKPQPKDAAPMPGGPDGASEPKGAPPPADTGDPKQPGTAQTKPDGGAKPMPGGPGSPDKGGEKPEPGTAPADPMGAKQPGGTGQGGKPDPEKQKEFDQAVKDLAGGDDKTKKDARAKLDKMVGEKGRKDIEKKVEDFQKAVNNLDSKDAGERKAAQDQLDKSVGPEKRKEIEDIAKGLKSDKPEDQKKAAEKLNDLQKQAGGQPAGKEPMGGTDGDPQGPKPDPKAVEQALKDLKSGDPQTRDKAKDELDKQLGKGAGQKAEDNTKKLNSPDPKEREAAGQQLKDMQKDAEKRAQGGAAEKKDTPPGAGGKKVDPKEVEKALDALNDPDQAKRDAAKQKLDDMLGKGAGQKAEDAKKDATSGDLKKEADGRRALDDLRNQAEEMAKGEPKDQPGKKLSKEDVEALAKKLNDLEAGDEGTRKAAEQELDKQIGEAARKQLQEAMNDPKKAAELKKKLDELAKNGGGSMDPTGNFVPKGGGREDNQVKAAMAEDARNRAKSAQLQLEQFEKNRGNKDLLESQKMTPEQYEELIKRIRERVAKLNREADEAEKAATNPTGSATQNVSGGRRVESGVKDGTPSNTRGPVFAAPGFAEAMKEFQKGATAKPAKKP